MSQIDDIQALIANRQIEAALSLCKDALKQDPQNAALWLKQALLFRMTNLPVDAIAAAELATRLEPTLPEAWHYAGFMNMALGQWPKAAEALAQAVALNPTNAIVRSQYALALNETDRPQEAYAEVCGADQQLPNNPEILMTMATILDSAGHYDLAQKTRPQGVPQPFASVSTPFLTGDYATGLRGIVGRNAKKYPPPPALTKWTGEETDHLLILAEQGFGDMILFSRYLSLAQAKTKKITLCVPKPLADFFAANFKNISFFVFQNPSDVTALEAKGFSAFCGLMELPTILISDFDALPSKEGYLRANPTLVAKWQERLAPLPRPLIGLSWAGNPRHTNDHKRSIPFPQLAPLIETAKGHWVSLQLGLDKPTSFDAFDAKPHLINFAESAALYSVLDLVITVDSAPAHLAGALNIPVWTLLPFTPDWRWLLEREDTLWYPSMRLFRQDKPGDWQGVIATLQQPLQAFLNGNNRALEPKIWDSPPARLHPQALFLPDFKK